MRVLNNLPQADLRTTAASAIAAEAAGYDGLLTMENKHDPFLAHAIAAVNTRTGGTRNLCRHRLSAQPDGGGERVLGPAERLARAVRAGDRAADPAA